MRELREVLVEAAGAHARAIDARREITAPAVAPITAIRRRRAWRATGAATASVAAVGALAFAAVTVPSALGGDDEVAAPYGDGPAWCDLDTYPVPNPEAFGPAGYAGRTYADYESNEWVYVSPDGEVQHLEPGSDGFVRFEPVGMFPISEPPPGDESLSSMPWKHMAFDYFSDGSAGGTAYLEDPEGPRLGYEWTTVAPDEVPAGVSPQRLMEVHTLTLGFSGTGLEPNVAGADAVVESVVRYDDGTEEIVRIGRGDAGAGIRDYDGLVSASIRATLPSGETYEITSYYDPSMTYAAACGPVPIVADDRFPDLDPGPFGDEEYVEGPYLEGPESAHFQCLAPLPEQYVAEPTRFERHTGRYYNVEETGMEFDFGDGGFIIAAPEEEFVGVDLTGSRYTGWGLSWSEDTGEIVGNVAYHALVWVDDDGTVVGRYPHQEDDSGRVSGGGIDRTSVIMGGPRGDRLWYIGDIRHLAVPCEGVEAAELDDAELAMIYGYGRSVDDMTWMVFYPDRQP